MTFLEELKQKTKELVLSAKFQTMVVGLITVLCAKIGFNADVEVITSIVAIISSYLLAKGCEDLGKGKQKLENESKNEIAGKILDSINKNGDKNNG